MIEAKHTYPPVGLCIYCGTDQEPLSLEHIVPLGLNGELKLPKSSCKNCASITGETERKVLRGLALQTRVANDYKSRRKKEMPKTFPLGIVRNGVESIIQAPVGKHPLLLPLPMFPLPSYMKEMEGHEYEPKEGIGLQGFMTLWFGDRDKTLRHYLADSIFLEQELDHISFARMLAKIAYSFAVAQLGLSQIEEAWVLPCILGKSNELGRWIGSTEQADEILPNVDSYLLDLCVYGWDGPEIKARPIVVTIRLFSHSPAFLYYVIVGSKKRPHES